MAELLKIYTARKEQLLHEGSGILGKYVEVADLRKGIIGILKRHMEKLGGKLRFEELSYKGMPYLDEYSKFWDSPMDAVEEAWKELAREKHMIDGRSIFSVGRNSKQPYSVAKETEAKKVNGRPHVEMKKVEVNSMGNRQTISAERKAFLVTELCRMVEENGGFFPKEANDVSRLSGLNYGELLKAFRSYDGIKSAAMNEWSKNGKRMTKVVEAERPAKKRRGSPNKISDDEIKQALRKFYETHGRLPLQLECGRANGLPSWNTLHCRFGPRNNWEEQLGIEEEAKPLKVEKTEVLVEPEAEPVVEVESETKPEDEPMVEAEPEVESEAEPMVEVEPEAEPEAEPVVEVEQPKVVAHELYSDGMEVQIIVKLPGQEKPLKITISQ